MLAMHIIFQTERLTVRRYTADDYDNYFSLHGDPVVMKYIRPAQTREESDAKLEESILKVPPHEYLGRWAVEEKATGRFIGSFVITPIPNDEERIQLGYSFLPEEWGKGYATEVAKAGVEYFYNRTPLTELYAVTETANTASENVLRKAGFQLLETKMEGEKELLILIIRKD
jgi:ribosomal-protein-alanine N-acetyltransferase